MHKTTALLLGIGLWMPVVSVVYFLGTVFALPFPLIVATAASLLPMLMLATLGLARTDAAPELSSPAAFLLLVGILLLCGACAMLGRRYGDFDAALIWNLHARHLATGSDWRRIYEAGASGNATYPFGLPGFVAACWWVVGSFTPAVPYTTALFATVGIPVVIFLQTSRRHLIVGAGVLAAFGLYPYYVALGLDQYADIQVAWLFLLSAICMERMRAPAFGAKYAILTGALLGAMCWTKYEGFLLSMSLLFWHPFILRKPRTVAQLLLGALPFALAWAVLRKEGAPASPLVSEPAAIAAHIRDEWRYRLTADAFVREFGGTHLPMAALLLAYPILCWRLHLRPSPIYGALWTALLGFAAVYILLVTTDLDWNLRFSLPRLLLQLYPTLIFIAASRVAGGLDESKEFQRR